MKSTTPQPIWILKHTYCDGTDNVTTYKTYQALLVRLERILKHADEHDQYEMYQSTPQTEADERRITDEHNKWQEARNK